MAAEPEAESQYYGYGGYAIRPYTYGAYPYRYGYNYGASPYYGYNRFGLNRFFKREAEGEADAESESQYYGYPYGMTHSFYGYPSSYYGYGGYRYGGYPYATTYGAYPYGRIFKREGKFETFFLNFIKELGSDLII